MTTQRIRIPLRSVTRKEVKQIAFRAQWLWQDAIEATQDNPYEVIWTTKDRKTSVHYIEDTLINVKYIDVLGQDVDRVYQQVVSSLPYYSWSEIQELFIESASPQEQVQLIYYAAIAAPQNFNSEVFSFFEHAVSSNSSNVRQAVIVSSGYVGWNEFRRLLQHLKDNDPENDVRQDASNMLESFAAQNS